MTCLLYNSMSRLGVPTPNKALPACQRLDHHRLRHLTAQFFLLMSCTGWTGAQTLMRHPREMRSVPTGNQPRDRTQPWGCEAVPQAPPWCLLWDLIWEEGLAFELQYSSSDLISDCCPEPRTPECSAWPPVAIRGVF